MLHERDAAALDRAGHEHLRPVVDSGQLAERASQLRVVVAVARRHMPAERRELRLEIAEGEDLLGRLVRLELVAVDDDGQPRQAIVGSTLKRLEVLPLLELAVSDHDDDAAAVPELPLRPGDAAALRDAHAERARVRLDPRYADVRVPVEAVQPPQLQELLGGQEAERVEHRVEPRHVMALRGEVHVAVRVVEAELDGVQVLVEEEDDDIHRAEARAEMARPCPLHGRERVQPAEVGDARKVALRLRELRLRDER